MKKWFVNAVAAVAVCAAVCGGSGVRAQAATIAPNSKAAYVCDSATGTAVYARNETEHLPIASMCKVMTLLLSFEAVGRGELSYDEMIEVSERAQSMGGSQVYLEAGLSYSADDLMRTVAVCSANDSCVALAERIGGSEGAFIDAMNRRAEEPGATETLFSNCTGLPKEPQYSCARDVAIMLRELVKYEKYFSYCAVRTEDFKHPDGRTTLITNTNKLIKTYRGCDGGKTGFTNEAGFCLAATAKQGETRLISVVIGGDSSENRFKDAAELLDYAFGGYETKCVLGDARLDVTAEVRGGKERAVPVRAENPLFAFEKKGENTATLELSFKEGLKAPIACGDEVGTAVLYRDGVEIGRTRLLADADVMKYSWWEAYRESARNWN